MPRPLRFEYEGALYHVLNRGNYRSWIFEDEGAKLAFEKCLFEACERTGWIIHAYCIMGNHYHLALETPSPNLSEGMKWLQGVYATRYNRFRKEQGHLFQGRFKSIVLENFERLAGLCHYIHLNPVRASIVDVSQLAGYRYSSYCWLNNRKGRRPFLSFDACLEGSGGLKNTPAGRRKYAQYLAWLNEDEAQQKAYLFDRMSKGWAHGTKEFKKALIRDGEKERHHLQLGGTGSREALELVWEDDLERCLEVLGKRFSDASTEAKSVDWKIAVCAWMKRRHLCRNRWLSGMLSMGVEAAVSRYTKQCREGERPAARKLLRQLNARIKN